MITDQQRINIANDRVGIVKACHIIEMDAPDFSVGSIKLYCPFGEVYHSDGGRSRAFRVYPGKNTAYCFGGCGFFTPVRLVAMARGMNELEAAEYLLDLTGYVAPDADSRWSALMDQTMEFDRAAERDALKLYCARICPDWQTRQFDSEVAEILSKCFAPLAKVASRDDLQKWRETTRAVMKRALSPAPARTGDPQ